MLKGLDLISIRNSKLVTDAFFFLNTGNHTVKTVGSDRDKKKKILLSEAVRSWTVEFSEDRLTPDRGWKKIDKAVKSLWKELLQNESYFLNSGISSSTPVPDA